LEVGLELFIEHEGLSDLLTRVVKLLTCATEFLKYLVLLIRHTASFVISPNFKSKGSDIKAVLLQGGIVYGKRTIAINTQAFVANGALKKACAFRASWLSMYSLSRLQLLA